MNMQHCNNKNHIRSQPPKQMKSSGVEAAINGEDRKVNNEEKVKTHNYINRQISQQPEN
jgi:hypothetical protein